METEGELQLDLQPIQERSAGPHGASIPVVNTPSPHDLCP